MSLITLFVLVGLSSNHYVLTMLTGRLYLTLLSEAKIVNQTAETLAVDQINTSVRGYITTSLTLLYGVSSYIRRELLENKEDINTLF